MVCPGHEGEARDEQRQRAQHRWGDLGPRRHAPPHGWLRRAGRPALAGRTPVLSFGSNRCPSKVVRQGGPFVNLECRTTGLAAVWSHGTRADGQTVATLVTAPDHEAVFFLSMCTDEEVELLDVVEGRGLRYDLVPLDPTQVVLEDGS